MEMGVISSNLSCPGPKEAKPDLASSSLSFLPSLAHLMMSFIILSQGSSKPLTGKSLIFLIYIYHCVIIPGTSMGK